MVAVEKFLTKIWMWHTHETAKALQLYKFCAQLIFVTLLAANLRNITRMCLFQELSVVRVQINDRPWFLKISLCELTNHFYPEFWKQVLVQICDYWPFWCMIISFCYHPLLKGEKKKRKKEGPENDQCHPCVTMAEKDTSIGVHCMWWQYIICLNTTFANCCCRHLVKWKLDEWIELLQHRDSESIPVSSTKRDRNECFPVTLSFSHERSSDGKQFTVWRSLVRETLSYGKAFIPVSVCNLLSGNGSSTLFEQRTPLSVTVSSKSSSGYPLLKTHLLYVGKWRVCPWSNGRHPSLSDHRRPPRTVRNIHCCSRYSVLRSSNSSTSVEWRCRALAQAQTARVVSPGQTRPPGAVQLLPCTRSDEGWPASLANCSSPGKVHDRNVLPHCGRTHHCATV